MYPEANIPVVQLSMAASLDPQVRRWLLVWQCTAGWLARSPTLAVACRSGRRKFQHMIPQQLATVLPTPAAAHPHGRGAGAAAGRGRGHHWQRQQVGGQRMLGGPEGALGAG